MQKKETKVLLKYETFHSKKISKLLIIVWHNYFLFYFSDFCIEPKIKTYMLQNFLGIIKYVFFLSCSCLKIRFINLILLTIPRKRKLTRINAFLENSGIPGLSNQAFILIQEQV